LGVFSNIDDIGDEKTSSFSILQSWIYDNIQKSYFTKVVWTCF
jgi:hypothetical protein